MRGKVRSVSLASTFLILAVMTFSSLYVQGFQATQPPTQSPLLIPPVPSAPYWTYTAGGVVYAVSVSADGRTIVAGGADDNIRVFGRQDNTTIWTYKTGDNVYAVAISADGNTTVAGGQDNRLRVFTRQDNTTIWTYKISGIVISVAISADGNTIVVGASDSLVRVFSRQGNTTIWTYKTGGPIYGVAVSADGKTIVGGGMDNRVSVFGRQDNTTIWTYKTGGPIYGVAVSANGSTIVAGSGGTDDKIRVFGRQDNTTIWTYKTGGDVAGVTVSSNGTIIAAGSTDQHLRLFLRTSNVTVGDVISSGPIVREVAMSSDGATIAWGTTGSPKAYLLSLAASISWSYTVPNDIGGLKTAGPAVGIAGDGSLAAYGCWDNKLYVFKYDTTAPALGSPSVSPSSPIVGQSINVSISATDNWELSTVTLYYRNASSSPWSLKAMSLAGGVYRATIGPYSAGVNVSYYINATDTSANFACSPANAPNSYYTIAIGQAGLSLITIALIGGVVAVVVIIAAVLLMRRGKRRRR